MDYCILENGKPKPATLIEWGKWLEANPDGRRVELTRVGNAEVSTVFLGLDHSFGHGPPLFFETMIFGGDRDQEQYRYATLGDAKRGHFEVVESLKQKTPGG